MSTGQFHGFDAPINRKVWKEIVQVPDRFFSIDGRKLVEVNLECMVVPSDQLGVVAFRLFDKLASFTDSTRLAAAYMLIHALDGRRKTSTTHRWLSELGLFSRSASEILKGRQISTITTSMYEWYASLKGASQVKLLRSALLHWISTGAPGIQPELITHLNSTSPKAPRGMIEVQNDVPAERPFSKSQVQTLLDAVGQLYVSDDFNAQEYFFWRAVISEGMRPTQMRLLQFQDFTIDRDTNGTVTSVRLMAAMPKQAGTAARAYMTEHRLSQAVGHAYLGHLDFVTEILGKSPPMSWPVFGVDRGKSPERPWIFRSNGIAIPHLMNRTRQQVADIVGEFEATDLFSRRLKHTKLTHLAAAGASDEVLAHAGYQTSTISLKRYVNLTEEAFAGLEELLEDTHQTIEDAFKGKVVDFEDATFQDPEHLIYDPTLEDTVGSCGAIPCEVLACLGCYICPRYEAFRDGPHERVEAVARQQQERARAAGASAEVIQKNERILAGVRSVICIIAQR